MDTLIQKKLQLEGDVRLLERQRKQLLDEISRIQTQKEPAVKEFDSLKKDKSLLAAQNSVVSRKLVNDKALDSQIVQNSTTFSQIKVDQTKMVVDSLVNNAQRRIDIADQKEKAVLSAFKRLTASENNLQQQQLFLQEQGMLLSVAREEVNEDLMKVKTEKRNALFLSKQANEQKILSDSMMKEAQSKLDGAKKLMAETIKQTNTQKAIINEDKKSLSSLRKSYEKKESILITRSAELKKKETWLKDKEETLKRGFEELRRKDARDDS